MYPMYGNMNNMGMMPGMPTPAPVMPMQSVTPIPGGMSMQGAVPMQSGMPMQGGMPMQSTSYSTNYGPGDSNSSLTVQVNNLEKRVARLEGMMSSNSTTPSYSESNFYMV